MATGARARATTPRGGLDRLDGVCVDVCLNGDGGDAYVPADVDPDQLAGAGQPVDVAWLDAELFGYLGHGEKLASPVHHRPPSRPGLAGTV